MSRKTNRGRFWILMLLIAGIGTTTMTGCFYDDRGHDHHDHHY